jgi:hypothetical protein
MCFDMCCHRSRPALGSSPNGSYLIPLRVFQNPGLIQPHIQLKPPSAHPHACNLKLRSDAKPVVNRRTP